MPNDARAKKIITPVADDLAPAEEVTPEAAEEMPIEDVRALVAALGMNRGFGWVSATILRGQYAKLSQVPEADMRAIYAKAAAEEAAEAAAVDRQAWTLALIAATPAVSVADVLGKVRVLGRETGFNTGGPGSADLFKRILAEVVAPTKIDQSKSTNAAAAGVP